MTDEQIRARLAHLRNEHPKEIGCRVGELILLLEEILELRQSIEFRDYADTEMEELRA